MGTQVAIYSYYNCIYHDDWYQPQQAGVLQITTPQNAKQATTKASGKASGKDFRKRKGAWLSAGIRCSTALNMPQDPTTATQTYWASTLLRVLVQWRPLDANAKRFENAIQKRAPKNSQPTSTESFFLPSFLPSHFSSSTFSLPRSSVIFPRNLSVRKCRRRRILWTMCTFTSSWICNAEFLTLTINTTKTNLPMKNTRGDLQQSRSDDFESDTFLHLNVEKCHTHYCLWLNEYLLDFSGCCFVISIWCLIG